MSDVWKILVKYDVDGEEEVIDFTDNEVEANLLVSFYQFAHAEYAIVRAAKESEDD